MIIRTMYYKRTNNYKIDTQQLNHFFMVHGMRNTTVFYMDADLYVGINIVFKRIKILWLIYIISHLSNIIMVQSTIMFYIS